ncbi:MAG TPA: sugar-transfer associated ATP-grasp domain-containing protein [Rhodocyclaceae bacterium]|nr:sugar-transfer associated ATP-grasp domain-containing protein [Rhodocyclaceae bacterium]
MENVKTFIRTVKRYKDYAVQVARDLPIHKANSGQTHYAFLRCALEQARLLRTSAIAAEDYYSLGLNSATLNFREKKTFLGSFEKGRYFDHINPPIYDITARDKVLFHLLADTLQIPTPRTLATTSPGAKPAYGVRISSEVDLISFLEQQADHELFFKPADGSLGEGALAIGRSPSNSTEWIEWPRGNPLQVSDVVTRLRICDQLGRFLIQARLRPHPALAEIVPNVCPTVRVMTLHQNGGTSILGAALRLGSGTTATDNVAGGGIIGRLDMSSGSLLHGVSLDSMVPVLHDAHPRTGVRITGKSVPDWSEVIHLVEQSAPKLNFIPCIGWDIGITDDGPVVIEINTRPRCVSVQSNQNAGLLAGPLGDALARFTGTAKSGLNF